MASGFFIVGEDGSSRPVFGVGCGVAAVGGKRPCCADAAAAHAQTAMRAHVKFRMNGLASRLVMARYCNETTACDFTR